MPTACSLNCRIAKLAEARGQALPAGDAATPAMAAAAPPAEEQVTLDPDLSLRELRARLLSYGLSTSGEQAVRNE